MIKACLATSRRQGDSQFLVVAIRNTASMADWLDGYLEPTRGFLV
jgi:hypothetical protein